MLLVLKSNVLIMLIVHQQNLVLTQSVLIHVHMLMLVENQLIVYQRIILEFVHVNRVKLVIHYWVVLIYSTVVMILTVPVVPCVKMVFVVQYARIIVIVSVINFVLMIFVNQHASITQAVPISNIVQIVSVFKSLNVARTMTVILMNNVLSIQVDGQSVRTLVQLRVYADVMLSVLLEIIRVSVHVKKDIMVTQRQDVKRLNVRRTVIVHLTKLVKIICVNWYV